MYIYLHKNQQKHLIVKTNPEHDDDRDLISDNGSI